MLGLKGGELDGDQILFNGMRQFEDNNVLDLTDGLDSLWVYSDVVRHRVVEVDITLNGTQVTTTTNTYPYRAYLETLLNYGTDAKETQLAASMFYKDTANQFDKVGGNDNKGMKERVRKTKRSHIVDMIGRVHADLFSQEKYLLNGVDLRLRLTRSKDAFSLMAVADAPSTYSVKIVHASLFVRKCKLNPAVVLGHAKALEKATAKYPVQRVVTRVISIPAGNLNVVQDNLFLDQLPKQLIIGLVDSTAFNGAFNSSPFEFKHHNLNFLALYQEGKQIPTKALKPNFRTGEYMRSYVSLFSGTNTSWKDVGNTISPSEYDKGYTLYGFDLTPSLVDGNQAELIRAGSLRLEMSFTTALEEPVHVIVYAQFDGLIEIDKSRQTNNGSRRSNSKRHRNSLTPDRCNITLILEYQPKTCFKTFGEAVSEARRQGDQDPSKAILAETFKLLGNSAYVKMKFDDVLREIGQFGPYQKRVYFLAAFPTALLAFETLSVIFIFYRQPHRCALPDYHGDTYNLQNDTHAMMINLTIPRTNGQWDECHVYNDFDVVCENSVQRAVSNMVAELGTMFGVIVCGFISDRYGAGGTTEPDVRCNGYRDRVVWRGTAALLFAYFIRNWRWLEIALSIPSIVLLFYWWLIPESPRWLASRGREDEAMKVLERIAKSNNTQLPKIEDAHALLEAETALSFRNVVRSRELIVRMLIVFSNLLVIMVVYYGLTLNITNLSGDIFINFTLNVILEIVSYGIPYFLVDRIGRRPVYCASMILAGAACVISVFPVIFEAPAWIVVALSMTGRFFGCSAFSIIYLYGPELFPTIIRSSTMGIGVTFARIGSIIAPYIADLVGMARRD
nr:hypothetical protein BaRGS_017310 [Batillaria attramentaria]